MALYDGVVSLSDNDVPVIVELGESTVRLSASGVEIGEWPTDECDITRSSDSTYVIHAEAETLQFVPTRPGAFAAAIGLADVSKTVPLPPTPEVNVASPAGVVAAPRVATVPTVPPAQPLTMGLFYALCLLTIGLAVWALISIVF